MRLAALAVKPFLVMSAILGVLGCDRPSKNDPMPNPYEIAGRWEPSDVSVTCSDPAKCPEAIGALFSVSVVSEDGPFWQSLRTMVYRCTAAVYGANKILTAGHCAENVKKGTVSYFKTASAPGRPSRTFKITRVLKSSFSMDDVFTPDYAAIEFDGFINDIDFVRAPLAISSNLHDITATVINQTNESALTVDAVDCKVRSTDFSPYEIASYPSIYSAQDCKLVDGNSGSPLFPRGDFTHVVGVLSRSTETKEAVASRQLIPPVKDEKTEPYVPTVVLAHGGCFDLPDWPSPSPACFDMSVQKMDEARVEKIQERYIEWSVELQKNWLESVDSKIRWKRRRAQLQTRLETALSPDPTDSTRLFLVAIPVPFCFEAGIRPSGSDPLKFVVKPKVFLNRQNAKSIFVPVSGLEQRAEIEMKPVGGENWEVKAVLGDLTDIDFRLNNYIDATGLARLTEPRTLPIPACSDALRIEMFNNIRDALKTK